MTCEESIKWLDNLIKTLGQAQYQSLWNWEQPLTEIKEMLESKRVVELPCKIGDTVYHYCKEVCAILPYFIERIVIDYDVDNSNGYWTFEGMCSEDDELIDAIDFTTNEIGKTVFLTKSEAEQKLKEMKENA